MLFRTWHMHPRWSPGTAIAVALVAAVAGGFAVDAGAARAARKPAPVPITGHWCGVTDDGGRVSFGVAADGRYVGGISISGPGGSLSAAEGSGVLSLPIADGMWIFRRDRTIVECEDRRPGPDPIRTPGGPPRCFRPPCPVPGCDVRVTNDATIRGTFDTSDAAHGTFTFLVANGRRRETGSYNAWPSSVAPCP